MASELESDLEDTVVWGRKWLVDFNAGKTQLVLFDQSNTGAINTGLNTAINTGVIDLKKNGSVLE